MSIQSIHGRKAVPLFREALLVGLLVWPTGHPGLVRYTASPARDAMVEAVGRCRVLEGRLVGGFEYAPYKTPISPKAKVSLARTSSRASPRPVEDDAVLGILGDLNSRSLDRSITLLNRTLVKFPGRADLLSDLSALLIARGLFNQDAFDLVLAVTASSKAVARDPGLAEAYFNLALALERLFLEGEACRAWDRYLQIDNQSDWAYEAGARCRRSRALSVDWERARLQLQLASMGDEELVLNIVRDFPRHARLYAETQLLGEWASGAINGRPLDSARALQVARAVGAALERRADHMVSQATAEIDAALEGPREERREALMRGHNAYSEGLRFSERDLDDKALEWFEEAATQFTEARSIFAYRAELKAATCVYYLGRPKESLRRLAALASRTDEKKYPTLVGEILWIQGLSYSKLANFPAAHQVYKNAEQLFSLVGEQESLAFLQFLLAESLRYQGQPRKALQRLHNTLNTIQTMGRTLWYHNSLLDAAEVALSENLAEAALYFQNEMVGGAIAQKDPITITESLLRRARTLHRLQDSGSALRDLESARTWSGRIASQVRRSFLQADIAMISAEIQRDNGDLAAATALLDGAIDEALIHARMFRLPDLYEARGIAHLQAGDVQSAEDDLRAAVNQISRQRKYLSGQELLASHFERSQRIFRELIKLKLGQKKPEEMFLLMEESRARALLDTFASVGKSDEAANSSVLSHDKIRRRLPPGVVLLEYSVLRDRLVLVVVSREQFKVFELNGNSKAIQRKVEDFAKAIRAAEPDLRRSLAKELYRMLLSPAVPWIEDASLWVFVPDQFLCVVPYSALVNPKSNRYLIEERGIALAPSATTYLQLSVKEKRMRRSNPAARVLVVSDPDFDRREFPELVRLRGAVSEAKNLARFSDADVLGGRNATPRAFAEAGPRYDIIHVAAHGRFNSRFPLHSGLILAPESSSPALGSGLLLARDIYTLRFTRTRLVILAACEGAQGQVLYGEGVESIGRSFLAAGVPAVVASLWKVEDRSAVEFFFEFHGALRQGKSAAEALRSAQLAFLNSNEEGKKDPQAWAGFHVLGGVS